MRIYNLREYRGDIHTKLNQVADKLFGFTTVRIALVIVSLNLLWTRCMPDISPTSITPSPQPTSTPNPTSLPAPTLSPTVTPRPELMWAQPDHMKFLGPYAGSWSPRRNEMVMSKCRGLISDEYVLYRVSAPEFELIPLNKTDYYCSLGPASTLWSLDGEQIVFNGRVSDRQEQSIDMTDVWIMGRNGEGARRVIENRTGTRRWVNLIGWMDRDTLVYSSYAGGGAYVLSAVDTVTHKVVIDGLISGTFGPPNRDYIPATCFCPGTVVTAFGRTKVSDSWVMFGPYARPVHYDYLYGNERSYVSRMMGWLPDTNLQLIAVYSYDTDPDHAPLSYLSLWDVDHEQSTALAPGVYGDFSPDGTILAFVTLGRPLLDSERRPIVGDQTFHSLTEKRYLNLLDRSNGTVYYSAPVLDIAINDGSGQVEFNPEFNISTDSRFISTIAPEPIQPGGDSYMLNVIETGTGKVLYSMRATVRLPVWSPDGQYLIFWNETYNAVLLTIADGTSMPITSAGGIRVGNAAWSYDGHYLSLEYQDVDGARPNTAVMVMEGTNQ